MIKYTIGVATLDGGKEVDCTQKDIDDIEVRNTKYAEQVEELKKTQYQRDRKEDYPDIGDQLDALYHAGVFPENMAAKIKAVKEKHPKE